MRDASSWRIGASSLKRLRATALEPHRHSWQWEWSSFSPLSLFSLCYFLVCAFAFRPIYCTLLSCGILGASFPSFFFQASCVILFCSFLPPWQHVFLSPFLIMKGTKSFTSLSEVNRWSPTEFKDMLLMHVKAERPLSNSVAMNHSCSFAETSSPYQIMKSGAELWKTCLGSSITRLLSSPAELLWEELDLESNQIILLNFLQSVEAVCTHTREND